MADEWVAVDFTGYVFKIEPTDVKRVALTLGDGTTEIE